MAFRKTFRFVERTFAMVGVATVGLTGAGIYLASSALKNMQLAGLQNVKLPDEFILELDLDGVELVERLRTAPLQFVSLDTNRQVEFRGLVRALDAAGADTRVKGLVATVGSLQSGGFAHMQELREALRRLRAVAGSRVPTIAFSSSFGEGGSGGNLSYYLASSFEHVYLQPTGLVSLTGFAVTTPFMRRFLDRLHVKPIFFTREEYKNAADVYKDTGYSPAHREATEQLVAKFMLQLVEDIAENRGLTNDQVRAAISEGPLLSNRALELGLLDGVAYSDQVLDFMALLQQGADPLPPSKPKLLVLADGSVQLAPQGQQQGEAEPAASHEGSSPLPSLAASPDAAGKAGSANREGSAPNLLQVPSAGEVAIGQAHVEGSSSQPRIVAESAASLPVVVGEVSAGGVATTAGEGTVTSKKALPRVPFSMYAAVVAGEEAVAWNRKVEQVYQQMKDGGAVAGGDAAESEAVKELRHKATGMSGAVALITASGNILSGKGSMQDVRKWQHIAATPTCKALEAARDSPAIKAIVLRVDSKGGSAVASDAIYQEVRKTVLSGKPVIVSMGNYAASGGYYIAAPATKIMAMPGTITGSIGVVAGKVNLNGLLKEVGIDAETISGAPNADALSVTTAFTPEQEAQMNALLDEVYETFVSRVAESRNMTKEAVRKVARGRVWTGDQAKEFGLVDELGGLRDAIALARKEAGLAEDAPVLDLPRPVPLLMQLKKRAQGMLGVQPAVGVQAEALQQLAQLLEAGQLEVALPPELRVVLQQVLAMQAAAASREPLFVMTSDVPDLS